MRYISFPFHGLEQLVEYNRNNTAVKRFLPIYASRCTRYPHYESPPAKTRSFPQHCSALENVAFNNSLGDRNRGSQHLVETPFQRLELTGTRKNKREYPQHRLGISIPASNGSVSGSLRETAREAISIRFRHRGKTMREERPPSTSATPYPNDRRAKWKTRSSNETKFNKNEPS